MRTNIWFQQLMNIIIKVNKTKPFYLNDDVRLLLWCFTVKHTKLWSHKFNLTRLVRPSCFCAVLFPGDFGVSCLLMGSCDLASTFTGTPFYMSPEVLNQQGYNSKSDMWWGLLKKQCTFIKHNPAERLHFLFPAELTYTKSDRANRT